MFNELIKKRVTKHNMTLENMINFNTGQIDSGTLGDHRPQFSSCSTNIESNSINCSNSKKSASNFNSALLHKDNISAQKKNTDNKEEAATTSLHTAEKAPAAATRESHLARLAAGGARGVTHTRNKRLIDQGTIMRPNTQLTRQEARTPPPPPPPQTLKPLRRQMQPEPTPPSMPPQRQATTCIVMNTPEVKKEENIIRDEDEMEHHTRIRSHDAQPQRQDSKQLQIKRSSTPQRDADATTRNDKQKTKGNNEPTTKGHALIILQRTHSKGNDIRWQQTMPPPTPQRLPQQPGLVDTKYQPEKDQEETRAHKRQLMPRARPCLTTSTPPKGLRQPRQSLTPPRVSIIRQVHQQPPVSVIRRVHQQESKQMDHKHEAEMARRGTEDELQRDKKSLHPTKKNNHSGLKRKKLKDMMMNVHTTITPYTNHYSEPENFAPLFLASRMVKTSGRQKYVYFACKACRKEIVSHNNFISHHRTLYHLQNMKDWIKKLIHNNYKDQIHYKTRKVSVELVKKAQQAITEHLQLLNQLRAKFHMKNNQQLKVTQTSKEADVMEIIQSIHQDGTGIIEPPKQIYELDLAAYSRARQAIIHECPQRLTSFKTKILNLLSNMYADRQTKDLRLQFSVKFYETRKHHRHWIIEKFETIKRRPNAWKFVMNNVNQNNLSFAWKNEAQKRELRRISSMARTLFHIFLECHFIPISYVILLAVLMNTGDETKYEDTSLCLNNGMMIDLALKEGAIIFQALRQKTEIIQLETKSLQNENDLAQYWRDDNSIFTSELSPTTLLSSVAEDREDENYQISEESCPANSRRQNMTKGQEYVEQETETILHPHRNTKFLLQKFEGMKQNITQEIATQEVIFNLETEQANIDSIQSRQEPEMQSEFDIQCNMLFPINPQIIAQKLFQHWGEQLNFYEDIHRSNNETFIIETVNELTNLAQRTTPYHPNHNQPEVKLTSDDASTKNILLFKKQ